MSVSRFGLPTCALHKATVHASTMSMAPTYGKSVLSFQCSTWVHLLKAPTSWLCSASTIGA